MSLFNVLPGDIVKYIYSLNEPHPVAKMFMKSHFGFVIKINYDSPFAYNELCGHDLWCELKHTEKYKFNWEDYDLGLKAYKNLGQN